MLSMESLLYKLQEVATKSTIRHFKVAAGLFYSKKGFVSTGYNCARTYLQNKVYPCIHAERSAIHSFHLSKRKKCPPNLMVIRTGEDGSLLVSRPCINCCQLIASVGIRKIYYINEDNRLVVDRVNTLIHFRECEPSLSTTDVWFASLFPNRIVSTVLRKQNMVDHTTFTKKMGETVKQLRIKKRFTLQQVASRASISLSLLQAVEENGDQPYDIYLVTKIKRALGSFTWE
jgi:deoxycytidylate deaminase